MFMCKKKTPADCENNAKNYNLEIERAVFKLFYFYMCATVHSYMFIIAIKIVRLKKSVLKSFLSITALFILL